MSWSLGEIQALAIKATRGAGFAWGLAEEAGFAVRWLETMGLPGCTALAHYLESVRRGGDNNTNKAATLLTAKCPLHTGAWLTDHGCALPAELGEINQPMLLLPFLSVSSSKPCALSWQATDSDDSPLRIMHIAKRKYFCDSSPLQLLTESAQCNLAASTNSTWRSEQQNRVTLAQSAAVAILANWASNTYAPATESSRLSGAGAGVSDND